MEINLKAQKKWLISRKIQIPKTDPTRDRKLKNNSFYRRSKEIYQIIPAKAQGQDNFTENFYQNFKDQKLMFYILFQSIEK